MFGSNASDGGIEELLSKLGGLKPGSLYKIRFGGVVGKIAFVTSALITPAIVMAYKATAAAIQLYCLGYGALVGVLGIGAIVFYGHKHPLEATLEGSQIVALKELQNQYAAKGLREVPDDRLVAKTIDVKTLENREREDQI